MKRTIFAAFAAILCVITSCGVSAQSKHLVFTASTASLSSDAPAASVANSTKTFVVLGDSYSTFEGSIPQGYACWYSSSTVGNDVREISQTWWSRLMEKDASYKMIFNTSYSGATICNRGYRGDDYSDRAYITRMKTDIVAEDGTPGRCGAAPDILFIFGGTNDVWAGAPMGEPTAKDALAGADMYQCLPAASYMLSYLTEKLPDTRIIVIINCDLSEAFTEGIQKVSKMYGVESILLKGIDKQRNHPSQLGMSQIADQLLEIL